MPAWPSDNSPSANASRFQPPVLRTDTRSLSTTTEMKPTPTPIGNGSPVPDSFLNNCLRTALVKDLPYCCSADDLVALIDKDAGVIVEQAIICRNNEGKTLQYGCAMLPTEDAVLVVMEKLHGRRYLGRDLRVSRLSKDALAETNTSGSVLVSFKGANAQVGKITEETLRSAFEQFGEIAHVSIRSHLYNSYGLQGGYGFLGFADPEVGARVVREINQTVISDVQYDCNWSKHHQQHQRSGPHQDGSFRSKRHDHSHNHHPRSAPSEMSHGESGGLAPPLYQGTFVPPYGVPVAIPPPGRMQFEGVVPVPIPMQLMPGAPPPPLSLAPPFAPGVPLPQHIPLPQPGQIHVQPVDPRAAFAPHASPQGIVPFVPPPGFMIPTANVLPPPHIQPRQGPAQPEARSSGVPPVIQHNPALQHLSISPSGGSPRQYAQSPGTASPGAGPISHYSSTSSSNRGTPSFHGASTNTVPTAEGSFPAQTNARNSFSPQLYPQRAPVMVFPGQSPTQPHLSPPRHFSPSLSAQPPPQIVHVLQGPHGPATVQDNPPPQMYYAVNPSPAMQMPPRPFPSPQPPVPHVAFSAPAFFPPPEAHFSPYPVAAPFSAPSMHQSQAEFYDNRAPAMVYQQTAPHPSPAWMGGNDPSRGGQMQPVMYAAMPQGGPPPPRASNTPPQVPAPAPSGARHSPHSSGQPPYRGPSHC